MINPQRPASATHRQTINQLCMNDSRSHSRGGYIGGFRAVITSLVTNVSSCTRTIIAIVLLAGSMAAHASTYDVYRVERPDGNPV